MKVAYLVNQYPHVSHSFIRREIAGVEAAGVMVCRFTVRPPAREIVDRADLEEREDTRCILATGKGWIVLAMVAAFFRNPICWLRAFGTAWQMGAAAGRRTRHLIYLAEACLLARWLRECGAAHLHAHFGTNSAAVARLTRLLGGPPYSFTVHGPEEFDRPDSLSLCEKISGATFVVAISSFGRSQLYRWARPEDWDKVRVVRCGVDALFLDADPLPIPSVPRLLCVGRLAEQKGQMLLLAAAGRLAAAGHEFELVLAGDGPMRPLIEEAVRTHGLEGRVRITGWLSNEMVRAEMLAARVFVLPSFAEGLPVVLMEALILGRPVVTTYIAGIPELVQDGVSGWLVPAGDVAALTEALAPGFIRITERVGNDGCGRARVVRELHDATREGERLAALFRASAHTEPGTAPAPSGLEFAARGGNDELA